MTVVGWRFKQRRYVDLHREAIRFPRQSFDYVGVNDPDDIGAAIAGENKVVDLYRADPYGEGDLLGAKRAARNPFNRQHGYGRSCPELATLLQHVGPNLFVGELPWSTSDSPGQQPLQQPLKEARQ